MNNYTWNYFNEISRPPIVENQLIFYKNIENVLIKSDVKNLINQMEKLIFSQDIGENSLIGINCWSYIMNSFWKILDNKKINIFLKNNNEIKRDLVLFKSYTKFIDEYFIKKMNLRTFFNENRIVEISNSASLAQLNKFILAIKFINECISNLKELFNEDFQNKLKDKDEDIIFLESKEICFKASKDKVRFLRSIAFIHIFNFKQNGDSYIYKGNIYNNDGTENFFLFNKLNLEEVCVKFHFSSLRNYLIYRVCILMKIYYLLAN